MDIKTCIELLKQEILCAQKDEIKIQGDELIYSLKEKTRYNISSYNQAVLGELGKAYAIFVLIDKFKIPPKNITREAASIVGVPSKRIDLKIDIADAYNERKCIALMECKTTSRRISDTEFTNYFQRQLYNISHSYVKDPNEPYPLVLLAFEVSFEKDKVNWFYYWFFYPEIEKIKETGQVSLEEIISRKSTFSYSNPPTVSGENVYFYKIPLKAGDLVEIKNPNELKKLLKEKIHQGLRKYGIVENLAFDTVINLLLAKTLDEIHLTNDPNKEPAFQVKTDDYLNPSDFYNRLKKLLEDASIQLLGEDPRDAHRKEILIHQNKEKILLDIVPYLQRIKLRSLRFLGEDSVGDVFLDFMHSIFRQSRGLFFTHPNICRFVCKAINVEKIEEDLRKGNYKYVLDPGCGSGTFLIEALRLIFRNYSIENIKENALKVLYGIDNNPTATALCKVNMVIHGDGSANVYTRSALEPLSSLPLPFIRSDTVLRFNKGITIEALKDGCGVDFIITNPPFSLEIKQDEFSHFRIKEFVPFKNNITTASECFFAERWFQLLNPEGRLGAVLPFSLFDSPEYLKARLMFLSYFKIIAIVGLPEHAFAPHAQQRTVLVFAKKRRLDESNKLFDDIKETENFVSNIKTEKIIFYDARNIGYIRTKKRKTVITEGTSKNDLTDKIARIISAAFDGEYISSKKINTFTLKKLYKQRELNLTPPPRISISLSQTSTLKDWEIVEIEKVKKIARSNDLLLCETGDIVPGGVGILTPKKLVSTTTTNRERIIKKIKGGKFGYLKEGDVVIAPVRIYQKKLAVITKSASNFLFSKDFIVLRKKDLKDLKDSFSLFLTLIEDVNIRKLEAISSTGKSGYPKIKNKINILRVPFYKIKISPEKLKKLIKLYEDIYKNLFINSK